MGAEGPVRGPGSSLLREEAGMGQWRRVQNKERFRNSSEARLAALSSLDGWEWERERPHLIV